MSLSISILAAFIKGRELGLWYLASRGDTGKDIGPRREGSTISSADVTERLRLPSICENGEKDGTPLKHNRFSQEQRAEDKNDRIASGSLTTNFGRRFSELNAGMNPGFISQDSGLETFEERRVSRSQESNQKFSSVKDPQRVINLGATPDVPRRAVNPGY
jgi:hypothetical protein